MRVNGITTLTRNLLPALHTMKVKGSSGNVLRQIVDAGVSIGLPLKKLYIDYGTEAIRVMIGGYGGRSRGLSILRVRTRMIF